MKLSEFTERINLSKLREKLDSELGLIVKFETAALNNVDFLLRVEISDCLFEMRIARTFDFKILLRPHGQFDYLVVNLPDDCMISEIDRTVKVSRIVEEHVKECLSAPDQNQIKIEHLIKLFNAKMHETGDTDPIRISVERKEEIQLVVPKFFLGSAPCNRKYQIARISEHSAEEIVEILKEQLDAIDFYKTMLSREEILNINFNHSADKDWTIQISYKDCSNHYTRVRLLQSKEIEIRCTRSVVILDSQEAKISNDESEVFYLVGVNEDFDDHDFLIEAAVQSRCNLEEFYETLSSLQERLNTRQIQITAED